MARHGDQRLWPSFWAKVHVNPETGCWEWQGWLNHAGYGRCGVPMAYRISLKTERVHRLTYACFKGPIAAGLTIDHLCRVRRCCNPDHLEAVTQRENALRGDTVNAANLAKTHCQHGHEFTPENTYVGARGQRTCRICLAAYRRRYYSENRDRLIAAATAYRQRAREREGA